MSINLRVILHVFLIFFVFVISGCKKKNKSSGIEERVDSSENISTELVDEREEPLNSVEIFESEDISSKSDGTSFTDEHFDDYLSAANIARQDFSVEKKKVLEKKTELPVVTEPLEKYPSESKSSLNIISKGVYIRVGVDRSGILVKKRVPRKITVGLFPEMGVRSVDIYIYAIPVNSHLVRNNNTLIGFAKGVDVMHRQAQFTRYWDGQLVRKRYIKSSKYNIYVEYHCRDHKKNIIGRSGRFWGGNHRTWFVRVQ